MKRLTLAIALLLTSLTCQAAEGYLTNLFIQGNVGWSFTGHPGYNSNGLYGASVAAGTYFTPNFGVQAGYTRYRTATNGQGGNIHQGSYDFLGLASIHLMDHFSAVARLGFAVALAHLSEPTYYARARYLRFAGGLGIIYDLQAHLFASLDWYWVQGKDNGFGHGRDLPSTNLVSLGLALRV